MNKYIFVLIVCAVVFLICFLIDTLFKLIFPKSRLEKSKQVVRPPRRSAVIGVILTFAGVAMLIRNLSGTPDTLFLIGSIVAVIFGVILLCTYFLSSSTLTTRVFCIRHGVTAKKSSATARSGASGACSRAAA